MAIFLQLYVLLQSRKPRAVSKRVHSPYVTAVGGAASLTRAWKDGGEGYSNVFPAPEYQRDAIAEYLAKGMVPSFNHFNVSGRAYPDVSAFATNFAVFHNGSRISVDGTSCATPTFAGLVSLLNDVRLQGGKKTLGLLNPLALLYLKLRGCGFFDITAGARYAGMCDGFQATCNREAPPPIVPIGDGTTHVQCKS